jgi:hypothetical protein
VQAPGKLSPQVIWHLEIRTDERNACRHRGSDGSCQRSDYVFSLLEQENERIVRDRRVRPEQIRAGHAEIIGNQKDAPRKLLKVLQRNLVLGPTPTDKLLAVEKLLQQF